MQTYNGENEIAVKSTIEGIGIKAISVAVPANVVEVSQYLQCRDAENIARVSKKTGISKIRIVTTEQTTSDMCFKAAQQIFHSGYDKGQLCAVVFVSRTPDYISPPTSCVLQARMGLGEEVLCYDSSACCYGYIAGLQLSALLAKLHNADVLLLTGDTNSKILNPKDAAAVMFGDAGSASIVGPQENKRISFHICNNGTVADISYIKDGGFKHPFSVNSLELKEDKYGNRRRDCDLHMRGLDMMNFVLKDASRLIQETIDECGGKGAFDIFALHQANAMIVKSLIACLSLPIEKSPISVDGYGNTTSASIPLLLSNTLCGKNLGESYLALLSGFGGGLSWGTAVTDVSSTNFYPVAEM